jgi:hypothetical protein
MRASSARSRERGPEARARRGQRRRGGAQRSRLDLSKAQFGSSARWTDDACRGLNAQDGRCARWPLGGKCVHTLRVATVQPGSADEESLVQLGYVEVDPATLAGPGGGLDGLLAGSVVDNEPESWPEGFPADGWRVIYTKNGRGRGSAGLVEVFAAPLPEFDGGFAMVSLALGRRDGKLRVGCDPGPVPVRPGKASRRQGLRLEWRQPVLRADAGQPLELTVDLVNRSWRRWHNVADDSTVVVGWLLDPEGNRVRENGHFHFGVGRRELLRCLGPGRHQELSVRILTPEIQTVPLGTYGLEAMLADLNLRSEEATLTLA